MPSACCWCTIKDKLTEQQALFQLKNAPLYQDKVLALGALRGTKDQNAVAAMFTLLENDYQGLRIEALKGLKERNGERYLAVEEEPPHLPYAERPQGTGAGRGRRLFGG
jgi:hypothetical protein